MNFYIYDKKLRYYFYKTYLYDIDRKKTFFNNFNMIIENKKIKNNLHNIK